MRETLSNIFYRMYYYNVIMSGGASIAGKIAVQVDVERDARIILVGWWVVGFAELSQPNYKPTMGGRCIETRYHVSPTTEDMCRPPLSSLTTQMPRHYSRRLSLGCPYPLALCLDPDPVCNTVGARVLFRCLP
jgi:hypothetical protein